MDLEAIFSRVGVYLVKQILGCDDLSHTFEAVELSANNSSSPFVMLFGKSLMFTENSLGSSKEPWGTPRSAEVGLELQPFTKVYCCCLVR